MSMHWRWPERVAAVACLALGLLLTLRVIEWRSDRSLATELLAQRSTFYDNLQIHEPIPDDLAHTLLSPLEHADEVPSVADVGCADALPVLQAISEYSERPIDRVLAWAVVIEDDLPLLESSALSGWRPGYSGVSQTQPTATALNAQLLWALGDRTYAYLARAAIEAGCEENYGSAEDFLVVAAELAAIIVTTPSPEDARYYAQHMEAVSLSVHEFADAGWLADPESFAGKLESATSRLMQYKFTDFRRYTDATFADALLEPDHPECGFNPAIEFDRRKAWKEYKQFLANVRRSCVNGGILDVACFEKLAQPIFNGDPAFVVWHNEQLPFVLDSVDAINSAAELNQRVIQSLRNGSPYALCVELRDGSGPRERGGERVEAIHR